MVRAGAPRRSIAASSTSPFITVASMPMESAVGRGRLSLDILTPRSTLPPPTTTPSVTPNLCAAMMSSAIASTVG